MHLYVTLPFLACTLPTNQDLSDIPNLYKASNCCHPLKEEPVSKMFHFPSTLLLLITWFILLFGQMFRFGCLTTFKIQNFCRSAFCIRVGSWESLSVVQSSIHFQFTRYIIFHSAFSLMSEFLVSL